MTESFSQRHGYGGEDPPITVWEDASPEFRHAVLQVARDDCHLDPEQLRDLVCKLLRTRPNDNNWSPQNVWGEVVRLVEHCPWHKVYDLIETIWHGLRDHHKFRGNLREDKEVFQEEVNILMREFGIGWKLVKGSIEARGEESYEIYLKSAEASLQAAGKATANNELREAIKDLSRRPVPDTTGAIQHAMAALECVARDATGEKTRTLGAVLSRHPDLLPRPVDTAVEKLWGYSSEWGRHLQEGRDPGREEAMLIVGIAASISNYLVHKLPAS